MGRTFAIDEDSAEGAHPVAVVSHGYWQRKLGSAPDAVGRTLTLNGVAYTIIGVTPPEFSGDWVGRPFDMWIPVAMLHPLMPELPDNRRGSNLAFRFIARVRPEVSCSAAEAAAHIRLTQIVIGPGASPGGRLRLESLARGFSPQRESFTEPLEILMAMVAALLLAACANVANLLMARSTARRQEITVRLAIGAGRARIVRQLLVESFLLAIIGGVLGAIFAAWGANLLAALARNGPVAGIVGMSSIDLDVHPDARIFIFNAAMCLFTGTLFGILQKSCDMLCLKLYNFFLKGCFAFCFHSLRRWSWLNRRLGCHPAQPKGCRPSASSPRLLGSPWRGFLGGVARAVAAGQSSHV